MATNTVIEQRQLHGDSYDTAALSLGQGGDKAPYYFASKFVGRQMRSDEFSHGLDLSVPCSYVEVCGCTGFSEAECWLKR
jgi:hypothetical protein